MCNTSQVLAVVAACTLAGFAGCHPAVAQNPSPDIKVPQNYRECDDLYGDLAILWATNMVGKEYSEFLENTNFDHLIPQLCKDGDYQKVYDIAKPFLTSKTPLRQETCEMSNTVGDWSVGADEDFYHMDTQAQIISSDKPASTGAPAPVATSMLPNMPQPTVSKPSALFEIDVKGAPHSAATMRVYTLEYDLNLTPPPDTVDVEIAPDKGPPRHGPAKVSGNKIDLTPLFQQSGSTLALPEYGFGKKARITIERQSTVLVTMDVSFDGLGDAEHGGSIKHAEFAQLNDLSRCIPHGMFSGPRHRPGPRPPMSGAR